MKITEDKSLCISLSRKGEVPIEPITSLISITFSAISIGVNQNECSNFSRRKNGANYRI
jgi:hypothetical protein